MLQVINWEYKLVLHLSKYGGAFTSTLGRYSILRETATSISMLEEGTPTLKTEATGSIEMSVPIYKNTMHHIPNDNDVKTCRLHWELHFMLFYQFSSGNFWREK